MDAFCFVKMDCVFKHRCLRVLHLLHLRSGHHLNCKKVGLRRGCRVHLVKRQGVVDILEKQSAWCKATARHMTSAYGI